MIDNMTASHSDCLAKWLKGSGTSIRDSTTERAITDIKAGAEMFYLTGSRFFHTDKPSSDFDFFVQSSNSVASYLTSQGFYKARSSSYTDDLTDEVYQKGMVHVQLVKDVALKMKIQQAIYDGVSQVRKNGARLTEKYIIHTMWSVMVPFALYMRAAGCKVEVVVADSYCSCSGEKVESTVNGRDFYYFCKGCKKEYVPKP